MEDAKKERTKRARVTTRRTNELLDTIKLGASAEQVQEKIQNLSWTIDELGRHHDEVVLLIGPTEKEELQTEEKWYHEYYIKVSKAIMEGKEYLERLTPGTDRRGLVDTRTQIKLKKLEVPTFNDDYRSYFKWKELFEKYVNHLDEDAKYYYLLNYTKGEGHKLVANKPNYGNAMERLDREYGNINFVMKLLIDDIRSLNVVRKGDHRAFENLSREVNGFKDKLELMGKGAEVENSYILQEIENKLNTEDKQKWLEHVGDGIDERKVEDICKWLEDQAHIRRLTTTQGPSTSGNNPYRRDLMSNPGRVESPDVCGICNLSKHSVSECQKFLRSTCDERWEQVKTSRLCFLCLSRGHRSAQCTDKKCEACHRLHHNLLHRWDRNTRSNTRVASPATYQTNSLNQNYSSHPSRTFLPIVKAMLKNVRTSQMATTLLDSGSEVNIISKRMAKLLGLKGKSIVIDTIGVGGVSTQQLTEKVELTIGDVMGKEVSIEAIVLEKACGNALHIPAEIVQKVTSKLQINPQNLYVDGGEIDLLLGMIPQLHKQIHVYEEYNGLSIIETRFGPCLVGKAPVGHTGNYDCSVVNVLSITTEKEIDLWKFVEAETAGIQKECPCQLKTDEEVKYDKAMENAWSTDEDGRFEVKLPWKTDPSTVPNNRIQALQRDYNLTRQLARKPDIEKLFSDQIQEMIDHGILKVVDPNYPQRYVPLLAVVDMEKDSTKVRICLDAKAKFKKLALNDLLLKGKLEMPNIVQILTAFRTGKYALIGDIRKMFWQIKLHEDDQKYHGIICKGNTYVFTRVCFGDKPSPNIAEEGMLKVAKYGRYTHPEASKTIMNNRYVDDIADSSNSEAKLIKKRKDIDKLFEHFGFEIKRWYSNNERVGTTAGGKSVLGCKWNMEEDTLAPSTPNAKMNGFTKRNVLSKIAEFWDPLGSCVGVIISARLVFQSIIRLKLEWDETITNIDLCQKWHECLTEMNKCKDIIINRNICSSMMNGVDKMKCTLIGFCDGSNVANGCVIYLRWHNAEESKIEVQFVASKGKLAPIKGITTPRNELCGALILARLTSTVQGALNRTEINTSHMDTLLYSDSTTVLSWVKADATRFKPFVKNKILEIQDLTPSNVWKYVPSSKNKEADLISKGCKHEHVEGILRGPEFLKLPRREWPTENYGTTDRTETELKEEKVMINAVATKEPIVDPAMYRSWKRLLRVTAYVHRFIKLIRQNGERQYDSEIQVPSPEEILTAEEYWIKKVQAKINLDDTATKKLVPFIDDRGIQRVYGRLKRSQIFDYNKIHPIIIPYHNEIAKLILQDIHRELFHPGPQRIVAESRNKYWIVNAKKIAKNICHDCVVCKRWREKGCEQIMANLPESRMAVSSSPFEYCAIDYFGPLLMKYGGRARKKTYGVIFTCLTIRAIYVDMATDFSTDTFLLALRRFISCFGQPKQIITDNGSNFVGASREIKELIKKWKEENKDNKKLKDLCAKYGIKWIFSTPLAPHHNGAVESMVKSVKSSLNKITKGTVLSEEEYRTVFTEITACVNSRPLWPIDDSDVELTPITCQDLLRPSMLDHDPIPLNVEYNPRKRYQYLQRLVNEWWRLWLKYFVPTLQPRNKWYKDRDNVEIGDIILVIDKDEKRSQWNMGKVLTTYPGKDHKVRSVQVQTKTGIYERPINKICILISKNEYNGVK